MPVLVADELQKTKLSKDIVIRKSGVFMNESGNFVKKAVDKYKLDPSDLYVIHDDLDIPLGSYKIQLGHGPKDHNGIKSIDSALGTDQYWHVRVGVDNRPADNRMLGEEYVLHDFSQDEGAILKPVINEICKKLATF